MRGASGLRRNQRHQSERGAVMIVALLVLAVLSLIGAAFLTMGLTDFRIARNDWQFSQALYHGEAGIEEAKYRLSASPPPAEKITVPQTAAATWAWYILSGHTAAQLPTLDSSYNSINSTHWNNSVQTLIQWGLVKIQPKVDGTGAVVLKDTWPVLILTAWGEEGTVRRRLQVELQPIVAGKPKTAAFGKKEVKFTGHSCTDSYNSNNGAYGPGNSGGLKGELGTDATTDKKVLLKGHPDGDSGIIKGAVTIGPGGIPDQVVTLDERDKIDDAVNPKVKVATTSGEAGWPIIPTPPDAVPLVSQLDKNKIDMDKGTLVLPEGKYWINELKIRGTARIKTNGNTTLFVKKNVEIKDHATLEPKDGKPGNLLIYVGAPPYDPLALPPDNDDFTDDGYTNGKVKVGGDGILQAVVIAPDGKLEVKRTADFFGSVFAKAVKVSNGGCIHYDEALDFSGSTVSGYTATAWRESSF